MAYNPSGTPVQERRLTPLTGFRADLVPVGVGLWGCDGGRKCLRCQSRILRPEVCMSLFLTSLLLAAANLSGTFSFQLEGMRRVNGAL